MFLGTFRSSVSLSALFFFLDLTFLLLMIGEFMQKGERHPLDRVNASTDG